MVLSRDGGTKSSQSQVTKVSAQPETKPTPAALGPDMTSATTTSPTTTPIPIAVANSTSTATTASALSSFPALSTSSTSSTSQNGPISSSRRSKERKRGVVHMEELPGMRVGPDDGPWPKEYEILETEEDVWKELRTLARPHRAVFINDTGHTSRPDDGQPLPTIDDKNPLPSSTNARVTLVDSINFQPCRNLKTQDRYVVTQLNVHGELWTLTGVFDGHLGDVTVEHVSHHLPIIIHEFLRKNLPGPSSEHPLDPNFIAVLFQKAILAFDDAIAHDVLDLFGGSVDKLNEYSDSDIRNIINDSMHAAQRGYGSSNPNGGSGENWRKARLCMYGTTALVALVDPKGEGLWVANLGDCVGILVTEAVTIDEDSDGGDSDTSPERTVVGESEWAVEVLTTVHNSDNMDEVKRIMKEHPGEDDTCFVDGRVLGAMAPTRCLGDIPFKQPPEFTRRVFYNLYPFVNKKGPWEEFLLKNKTPPYISAEAEVVYRNLSEQDRDRVPHPNGTPATGKRRSRLSAALKLEKLAAGIKKKDKKNGKKVLKKVVKQRYLILASDGFSDLCSTGGGIDRIVRSWAREMSQLGCPGKEIEETRAKLRERDLAMSVAAETATISEAEKPAPPAVGLIIDTSIATVAVPATAANQPDLRPNSPGSPTSPVPFTGNSFSSSMGSLTIPAVESNEAPPLQQTPQTQVAMPVLPKETSSKPHRPPLPRTNKSYHCTSSSNMALRLLRRVLSGEERNNDRVAKALTVDMDVSWVDDTAIVVVGI
ncbi:protein serine/threonine phosphatase 2C [Coprinopsis marcescibilis]|uniref:Protein serine/threonine phosphatase 2C n=1 Tax=Coprinopsis marcescibilis TaxID=230819 RepID=A0A5C3KYM8_COPMA|nr:protein serine/threonine phosphatase 2C [Coprinopsis marcescibilis]